MEGNKKNNRYLYGGIRIMKKIDSYVDKLFKNIPQSRQKDSIVKDIKQNQFLLHTPYHMVCLSNLRRIMVASDHAIPMVQLEAVK